MEDLIIALIAGAIIIVWNIFIGKVLYNKLCNTPKKSVLYIGLFFIVAPFAVIIASFIASVKINRDKEKIYASLTKNPNNANVDMLINFIEKNGCVNTPNAWHQLRGVWYACNHSSNITSDKKQELQTYLMLKGLYLSNEEKRIVNNYGK